ncbi:MAG TPA: membrane dipeptidase [Actinomycetota bacterium]|nr:membrane dipeptidase [Actinomycetota bacterium]
MTSDERVERIHRDGVVVDMVTNLLTEGVLRGIDDFRAGGVHLICQSIDPPWRLSALARPYLDLTPDPQTALRTIAWVRRLVQAREDLAFVETVDDVHAAKAAGRLGVSLHSQNATPFALDLDLVGELYAAGLRMSALAYNVRSLAADGCIEETNAGLSRFGRRLVLEMNRVGMIVDGSHVGVRSTLEAMDVTESPFVFSHNGCAAVHEHPRNLTDEQLRRCAETGGVIGVLAIPLFLSGEPAAPFEALLRHLFHAIEIAGVEHVGLGLDHWYGMPPYADLVWPPVDARADDGVSNLREIFWDEPALAGQDVTEGEVDGLGTPAGVPLITAALLDHGLPEAEVAAVLGGNWVRVLGSTWR